MKYDNPVLKQKLSEEYVLGTLHGLARARFEKLLAKDRELQQLVDQVSAQWNPLVELVLPVNPPPGLWGKIKTAINAGENPQIPSNITGIAKGSTPKSSTRLRVWQGWAIAATVLVGVLLFDAGNSLFTEPSPAYVILVTEDANSQASWLVSANPESKTLQVKALSPQPLPRDTVFQLWIKVKNEEKVRSVGLIPASGEATISITDNIARLLAQAEKFGVSVEPPGGSPTGQPTSQPLYHGKLINI